MIPARCPDRDLLHDYCVGRLSATQLDEIASHVESCGDCQAELMTLDDAADTLVGSLRAAGDKSYANEPILEVAMEEARGLPARAAVASHHTQSFVPYVLGEYELLEELGRGGMGRVYKARHTKLDREVAVKILPRGRLDDPRAVTRFEREMRAIGRLSHPHVVHAYDAREIDQMPVLIMEYVDGMDLEELTNRLGPLEACEACEIVRQVALGLQYAHEHGLVHRDIKPSNVMITRAGSVKLLDLGLARFCVEPMSEEMTRTGQMMGTADYVAPEQLGDSRTVDIRADIYGLGCTLYKLLSGSAPYSGPDYRGTLDKLHAHVHHTIPPIARLVPTLPSELIAILDRMLAKTPEDRFGTPEAVAQALEPWCAGANLAERVQEAAQVVARPHVPGHVQSAGSHSSQSVAQPQRSRARRWAIVGGLLLLMATSFAAGVLITVYRNGRATQLEVPEGSQVRVNENGNVDVTLPSAAVTERGGVTNGLQTLQGVRPVKPLPTPEQQAATQAAANALATVLGRLKEVGVAMHKYHDQHGAFPSSELLGEDGQTPHSWRVALLPFLGHQDLYDQYRRDEPWDSPHNLRVLVQMPEVYRAPSATETATTASLFALVGPDTAFPAPQQSSRFIDMQDGTSPTILLVQTRRNIPWTKPEDIAYQAGQRLPRLGGFYANGFHAIFADGAVHFLDPPATPEPTLRAWISRAGGERVELPKNQIIPQPIAESPSTVVVEEMAGKSPSGTETEPLPTLVVSVDQAGEVRLDGSPVRLASLLGEVSDIARRGELRVQLRVAPELPFRHARELLEQLKAAGASSIAFSPDSTPAPAAAAGSFTPLDFRIAPVLVPAESDTAGGEPATGSGLSPSTTISPRVAEQLIQHLHEHGPELRHPHQWFKWIGKSAPANLVTADYQGQEYMLLSSRESEMLQAGNEWSVEKVTSTVDEYGHPSIAVRLDQAGGKALETLTKRHLGDHLAIVVHDQVVTAPRLVAPVGRSLRITGAFTEQDARWVTQLLTRQAAEDEKEDD